MEIKPIGKILNNFNSKFGIPRQSGLCNVESLIVIEKEFSVKDAFRGIEEYSHLWLIWEFSEFASECWSPTVRPPRLGGNKRVGVFATRSPNRPNSLGLSSVRLSSVSQNEEGQIVLKVIGADLMNGTSIFDIKPYVSYSDSHTDAVCGFADDFAEYKLSVSFSEEAKKLLAEKEIDEISSVLSNDPKPSYQHDFHREYGMSYGKYEIKFKYSEDGIFVFDIQKI